MGDRGQIAVVHGEGAVYLYSHWGGTELAAVLRSALLKKWRWDDNEYLTRIIFDEMVGDSQGSEMSYGIGLIPHGDIEHALLVVDTTQQAVGVVKLREWDERREDNYSDSDAVKLPLKADRWIPFTQYIELDDEAVADPDELLNLPAPA